MVFWCHFRALGRSGAKLVPEPPPRTPGMVPDATFNDFSWFFNRFLIVFCVRPLALARLGAPSLPGVCPS